MLRAKDGSTRRDWRRLTQGSAVALVMTIAFLSAAIRGLAEPPEIDSDGSIRVAKSTDAKPKPAKPIVNSSAEATSFLRPPIDISKFALAKNGGSLLRLGEICQQPRFAQFVRKYDVQLAESWKATFLGAEAPPFSLQDIEYIVGDCMFTARVVKPPKEETNPHPHQICFGVSYGFIRWQKPVDKIVAWLNRTPGAEQKQHGEVSYVELPRGLLGPEQVYVCSVDDHTILWSGGEATFLKRLDKFLAATDPPAWHNAWKEVEGGLFTAIAAETQYKVSPDFTTEPDELTREFFDKTRLLGVSLDWQPQEHGDMTYKIHARFDSEADARSIEVVARRALELAIQEARQDAEKSANENNELAEKNKLFATSVIALLQSALIETSESETGWQINVRLSGPIDIESGL